MTMSDGSIQTAIQSSTFALSQRNFSDLAGFDKDNLFETWKVFLNSCESVVSGRQQLRAGRNPTDEFKSICVDALAAMISDAAQARFFFESRFQPYEIVSNQGESSTDRGFLTGYYEPFIEGSIFQTADFTEPILGRPEDLVTLETTSVSPENLSGLAAARKLPDGSLQPYPTRSEIDSGAISNRTTAIFWVRDPIELFMIQVQGSAAIVLNDGTVMRLTYAGRNGHKYTSIGKILVESGEIPIEKMSLVRLKNWVRENGQNIGEKGRALLHRNASYVFFKTDQSLIRTTGPIGAQGVPLSPLRSIAVDRNIWPYGLPFWIEAVLPWEGSGSDETPFNRMMIAQDTGSAITGHGRADIYFGSGDSAGKLAGGIRHFARMNVLLPKNASSTGVK